MSDPNTPRPSSPADHELRRGLLDILIPDARDVAWASIQSDAKPFPSGAAMEDATQNGSPAEMPDLRVHE